MNVIIDYNVGNLNNLKNALAYSGVKSKLVSNADEVKKADRILLPGVGAFKPAMNHLKHSGMLEALHEKVLSGTPMLGVCVGAQLLMDNSEEDGIHEGLGWIQGEVKRFSHKLKIPQIGWNSVKQQKKNVLFKDVSDEMYFYFVHSYHLEAIKSDHVLGTTNYGYDFTSVVSKDNLWGVQFHPEKSQNAGLQLLKNFCTLT
ncbi:MAG: imidazole glycerol phosphate synthase subunit HisH [Deltaproteobacteria bacterium]|nr:imidazole glycerol phosphate synthase subunit HisH [Deltaproteobacteria bacterium]